MLHRGALILASILFLNMQACSNFESGNSGSRLAPPPVDTTPPEVIGSYPDSEQENIEADEMVELQFSELLDEESLLNAIKLFKGNQDAGSESGIIVERRDYITELDTGAAFGNDPVTGEEIEVETTILRITQANGRFSLNTPYTLLIEQDVKDRSTAINLNPNTGVEEEGNFLVDQISRQFTVDDGVWLSNEYVDLRDSVIDTELSNALAIDAKSNASGQTMAAIKLQTEGVSRLYASRYLMNERAWVDSAFSGGSINTADPNIALISAPGGQGIASFSIAVNNYGHAVAVWLEAQDNTSEPSVWVNYFDGLSWQSPLNLGRDVDNELARSPSAVIDDNGNIQVVWSEMIPGAVPYRGVVTNRMSGSVVSGVLQSGAWLATPLVLNETYAETGDTPLIKTLNATTNVVMWRQSIAGQTRVVSRQGDQSGSWSAFVAVSASNTGSIEDMRLATNGFDSAAIAWLENDGARRNLWASLYTGGGWSTPMLLERDDRGDVVIPNLDVGMQSQVTVVWGQRVGNITEVYARTYQQDTGWQTAELLDSVSESGFANLQLKYDREGNANVLWSQGSSNVSLVGARYKLLFGWTDAVSGELENYATSVTAPILVPLGVDGQTLVLMSHYDGERYRLASNLFTDG
ncbi:MAG: Ig-like domain-containing protein [Oleiphilaceae bacterium]|nr:Ig-like domain-containing protein [Oleiphilaceae bacterium]